MSKGAGMIFKVQRPIVTTDVDKSWLVYNESRSTEFMMLPMEDLFEEDEYKIFVDAIAKVTDNGLTLVVTSNVEDQLW